MVRLGNKSIKWSVQFGLEPHSIIALTRVSDLHIRPSHIEAIGVWSERVDCDVCHSEVAHVRCVEVAVAK